MGYERNDGRYADVETVYLTPPGGSISGDLITDAIELGDRAVLRLVLDVTSVAATSLDVTIETGPTAAGPWQTTGTAFTQATGATSERKVVLLDRFVRANYNHTGSGAIAFTLVGEAA